MVLTQSAAAREAQREETRRELQGWLATLAGVPPRLLAPPKEPESGAEDAESAHAREEEARAARLSIAFAIVMARAKETVDAAAKKAAEAERLSKELNATAAKVAKERSGRLFFVVPEALQAGAAGDPGVL